MAIKLADTLAPMADFPAAMAEHIEFSDGENLQKKLDDGSLGGGGATYTQLSQEEYDVLSDDEKVNGTEYRTYDTGRIFKNGVEYGKDASADDIVSFAKPSQLGLDDTSCTVVDLINAMFLEQRKDYSKRLIGIFPYVKNESNITDLPTDISSKGQVEICTSGWDMASAKFTDTANCIEYIGRTIVASGAVNSITWKKVATTITSLAQLGLTADGTVNDIIAKLSAGESALINVAEFNDRTQFPDTSSSSNMATVSVRKTNEIGRTVVEWFKKDGRYAVAVLDGNNKISGWREYAVETKKGLAQNSQYYKIDITKKGNKYRNGVVRFSYNNGYMPCEVAIFLSYGDSTGHIGNYTYTYGTNCIQSITLTGNDTNVVIGIELTKTVYGTQLVEVNDSFCTINNLTAEQFTGDTVATYNDSSKEILHTDLSGNLAGITTVLDLVNALVTEYRAMNKPVRFVSGNIAKTTLTDLPRNYGLLQITVYGYDVVEVSFAGSSFGFKTMHYGFVNRTSSETLFSSLFWEIVDTPVTELIDLGLDGSATIQNVMDAMTIGQHCILNTSRFDDKTQVGNIEYGKVEIRRLSSGMWSLWLEDVLHANVVAHGTCSGSKFAGWQYLASKDYVDSKHNYSTTETAVGTWIDGKTIYRKTFTKSPTSDQATGNTVTINVATISGLTNVIDIQATAKLYNYNNTSTPIYMKIPFTELWRSSSTSSASCAYSVYVEGTALKMRVNNCAPEDVYYITVEYTK